MYGIFTYIYHKNQTNVGLIYHTWMVWDRISTSIWCHPHIVGQNCLRVVGVHEIDAPQGVTAIQAIVDRERNLNVT